MGTGEDGGEAEEGDVDEQEDQDDGRDEGDLEGVEVGKTKLVEEGRHSEVLGAGSE